MGATDALWTPLGRWRTDALWRLFGACLVCNGVYDFTQPAGQGADWLVHGLSLCGLLLCSFGARLASIALTMIVAWSCFGLVLSDRSHTFFFPAAEWTIWVALPTVTVVLGVLGLAAHARRGGVMPPRESLAPLDGTLVAVFRAMVVVALGSAALHKINRDFFDPSVSCMELEQRLVDWWQVPSIATSMTPLGIVIAEATVPVLLMVAPSIGIPAAILLVSPFMSIGAPPFALLVVTMAMAFLPDEAGPEVQRVVRKWGAWLLTAGAALAFTARTAYRGDFPWPAIGLAQTLTFTLACIAAAAIFDHLRRKRDPSTAPAPAVLEKPSPAQRATFAVFVAALVLNSLTPYLGIKFQFSFAMLSNLRADDDRWNSLIFPRSLRLTAHDPFVHVTRVRYTKLSTGQVIDGGGILPPAVYAPSVVTMRVQRALERGVKTTFDFRYEGKAYAFAEAQDPTELYNMVSAWPTTPLFQKVLDAGKPQTCQH
jgi:hypothetical protein